MIEASRHSNQDMQGQAEALDSLTEFARQKAYSKPAHMTCVWCPSSCTCPARLDDGRVPQNGFIPFSFQSGCMELCSFAFEPPFRMRLTETGSLLSTSPALQRPPRKFTLWARQPGCAEPCLQAAAGCFFHLLHIPTKLQAFMRFSRYRLPNTSC